MSVTRDICVSYFKRRAVEDVNKAEGVTVEMGEGQIQWR